MALISIKNLLAESELATPAQFEDCNKAWRVAVDSGSQDSLLSFICRERGFSEEVFLQQLAKTLGWTYLELAKMDPQPESRNKISTKVAFQYFALPTKFENGVLQVAVSN